MENRKTLKGWLLGAFLLSSLGVNAQMNEVPHTDGMLYYRIGGGRHITIPPSLTITTINLSASASLGALNCGRFDLGASVQAFFKMRYFVRKNPFRSLPNPVSVCNMKCRKT